jgi:hypothetical protein
MTDRSTQRLPGISLRALVIAAVLSPLVAWINISVEAIRYAGQPTTVSVFPHVLAILLLLIGVSSGAARIRPSWRLQPAEIITIYFLVLMAAVMSAHDTIEVLVPILTYPFRYANPANRWATDIIPHLPQWLMVADRAAVERYWIGGADLWSSGDLRLWAGPMALWTPFLTSLVGAGACINALLRRQWADHERLAFPLVQLPIELAQPRQPLWTNRLFLAGFSLAVLHDTWFGLHSLWPAIPEPYTRWQTLQQYLTAPPWNAIAWLPFAFFPWIMGLGVLLPTDLLFSCWFFFIIWKLQPVAAAHYGYTDIPGFPFVFEQSFGAYVAIAIAALYAARRALWKGVSSIWRAHDGSSAGEALSSRATTLMLAACLAFAWAFLRTTGMAGWIAGATLAIYFVAAVAITRLRAELGTPAHDLGQMGPMRLLPLTFGRDAFRDQDLSALALTHGFNRNYRACPMAVHAEGLRAADRTGGVLPPMFWALIGFAVWGTVCGFIMNLDLNYRWGAISHCDPPYVSAIFGREPYDHVSNVMRNGITPAQRSSALGAMTVGFTVASLLSGIRMRMVGFPFHPVGYAISSNWCMSLMWPSIMAAWAIKVTLLRAGGLRLYRQALPLFLGIVLGECSAGTMWMGISALVGTKTFIVWPYG